MVLLLDIYNQIMDKPIYNFKKSDVDYEEKNPNENKKSKLHSLFDDKNDLHDLHSVDY